MGTLVYALCALTSLGCCGLLFRHYLRERSVLLFRSSMAFLCFAVANIILFIDLIVVPQADLRLWRNGATLIGVVILLVALLDVQGRDKR